MNQKAAHDRDEPREGYVAPALTVLGSLEELTLGDLTITQTLPISPIRGY
jgi:hypothetical protein